ncbi:MAG: FAD-dependent oxidoreductase [Desulfobacteraceae bacterium]|nr:FAD-dependent oxidoreductase [Desulfobacteraceae bacterium]
MSKDGIDIIVVGSGPGGSTAAFYGQRLGLSTVVFGDTPGGNLYMIRSLNNFPGYSAGIGGTEFGINLFQQAQNEGAQFTMTRLTSLNRLDECFQATDSNEMVYTAQAAVIASGRTPKPLPDQDNQLNGIGFCSVCDGPLFRNQHAILAVVGSDNAAAQHALTLSDIAKKVYLIHRSPKGKMDAAHLAKIAEGKNIEILSKTEVIRCVGDEFVRAVDVRSPDRGNRKLPVNGVFLAIGWKPNTDMIDFPVETTSEGYIKTDFRLMSSIPGLFAAGDVRDTDLPQVLTACADGARAAKHAAEYIRKIRRCGCFVEKCGRWIG